MAKGYWIGRVDVDDLERYQDYVKANAPAFEAYDARFVIRGGQFKTVEGQSRARNVVIEFPSYQAAVDCYNSDVYQAAKSFRDPVSVADLIIIEGYDG
ncbi:DUF1330 domain-containing protein [uncultured Aliiroseovarius sp.]|uniref:DUF1330 domain-containing protein n=1 Tax=uncultured Aliiroseovarius sp. TaxID=1658783 RepID=UPI00261C03ED|nr:DUF1330 domain-containing protein [uncultured Aliiroseovarius sp.]